MKKENESRIKKVKRKENMAAQRVSSPVVYLSFLTCLDHILYHTTLNNENKIEVQHLLCQLKKSYKYLIELDEVKQS